MRRLSSLARIIGTTASTLPMALASGQCTTITDLDLGAGPAGVIRGIDVDVDARVDGTSIIAVGMPQTIGVGTVRIMRRQGIFWSLTQTLSPVHSQTVESFGRSVDFQEFSGTTERIIAGAPTEGSGMAFVFEETAPGVFNQTHAIFAPSVHDHRFGTSVALSRTSDGSTLAIVSDPESDDQNGNFPDIGRVYVFKLLPGGTTELVQTWFGIKFINESDLTGANNGASIDASTDIIIAGSPNARNVGTNPNGSGVILEFNDLENDFDFRSGLFSNQDNPGLGSAVAVSGDWAIVGAPRLDSTMLQTPGGARTDCGSVTFVHLRPDNTQTNVGPIFAPDASDGALFGSSVDIFDTRALIGAPGVGRAYLYRNVAGVWYLEAVYNDDSAPGSQAFGTAVALSATEALVTDPFRIVTPTVRGAAYAYRFSENSSMDTCQAAVIYPSGTVSMAGCNVWATTDSTSACGGGSQDVWYTFLGSCTGQVQISLQGSNYDTILSVHSSCPNAPGSQEIACNDDVIPGVLWSAVTVDVVTGTWYFVRVAGFGMQAGNHVIAISSTVPAPVNDLCANAQTITPGVYSFKTCNANTDGVNSVTDCTNSVDVTNDVWFRYVPTQDQTVTLNTCGSFQDTAIQVWAGSPCGTSDALAIACNDDSDACLPGVSSLQSMLQFDATAGVDYLIRFGTFGASSGADSVLRLTAVNVCACDFDGSGDLSVNDIFGFLNAWFAGLPSGDFDSTGVLGVNDIFDFLNCWFAGC